MADDKLDFQGIADAALNRAEELVADWLPNGNRAGHEWRCGNLRGDAGRSLSVNLSTGVWADFSSGEKGSDLISLYAAIHTGNNQGQAARELSQRLGVVGSSSPAKKNPVRKSSEWSPILPVPPGASIPPVAHAVRGRPSHTWAYKDSAGAILGYIHRFNTSDGGKEVLPCVYAQDSTGRRDWRWMQFPVPRPLYGLHDMSGRDYVLVVEGEKCRDAAAAAFSHVYDVVSWPGGGKAVSKADWSPLAGRKVIIWPDCDAKVDKISGDLLPEMPEKGRQTQPGIKAAEDVANILLGIGCVVRIIKVPAPGAVADGWDVVDALDDGRTPDELLAWIRANLRKPQCQQDPDPVSGIPDQDHVPDSASTPGPADADRYWKDSLICRPRGGFEDCKENVALALERCPELRGMVGFNEFSGRIEKLRQPPWDSVPGEWTTDDDLELSMWLGTRAGLLFRSTGTISEGVRLVATRNKYHPVREYLMAVEKRWDGQERNSLWLHRYLGAEENEYTALIGRLWLRQAVRRVLYPGCKADYVLILEGSQGAAKSTSLRVLGGEWFSDAPLDMNNKDAYQQIFGVWIYEIAELDAFNRAEATRIKAFLTQNNDRYRPAYERRTITQLRQTVFAATTNFYEYHKDPTGNRRFWSVLCGKIDIPALQRDRDQLFAQAVAEVLADERAYPTRQEEQTLIVPEQQMREIVDPWMEVIAIWLNEPEQAIKSRFTSADILMGAIKMEISKIDGQRSATTRVGSIMMRLGWRKIRESGGLRTYFYVRPSVPPAQQQAGSDSRYSMVDEDADLPI
ncbi:VapE domain-containing protein [Paracandidimonas soli]